MRYDSPVRHSYRKLKSMDDHVKRTRTKVKQAVSLDTVSCTDFEIKPSDIEAMRSITNDVCDPSRRMSHDQKTNGENEVPVVSRGVCHHKKEVTHAGWE